MGRRINHNNNNNTTLLPDNIPAEMKGRRQWVCYSLEPSKDGVVTKIPREPKTGGRAKSNDASCWTTFEDALSRVKRYAGLGYMLAEDDPYTFIDLDDCIDTETGDPLPWAQKIINRFDSYTEKSQSGRGIHIIGLGAKPGPRCRISNRPGIEIYDSLRFLVVTGDVIQGKRIIQPCGNEIAGLYLEMFGKEEETIKQAVTSLDLDTETCGGVVLDDIELIKKACGSEKNGPDFELLWNGNIATYNNDWSAADQALCNHLAWWTNRDAERIDRMFRLSGLMRDKWEKRPDYRKRTIDKAIKDTRGGYTGKTSSSRKKQTKNHSADQPSDKLRYLTDLGNAEHLIANHGDKLRYDVDSGHWLHWCGTHWKRDDTGEIERITRATIRSMYDLLKDETDLDRSKALFSHIKKSESKPRMDAMISVARYCPGIPVKAADIDADHWKLNCLNGTINLETGKLQPHSQNDLISKIVSIDYDPAAKCPRWIQFLDEVFQGDKSLIDFVHRMVGYCLTGDTREESVFILYGKGQCGKSKFLESLRHILGDYIKDTPVSTFVERNDTNTADLASLVGSRLVTASEAEENQKFNEPLLKRISGRDPITCRYLYKDFFTYVPSFKVVLATNDVPYMRSQSFAMKRRIKIVPFKQRFHDPEECKLPVKDDQIGEKLYAELPGILAWAVQGCLKWQKSGLNIPTTVKREVNALFESQDPLVEFIDSQCVLDREAMIETGDLWRHYLDWCKYECKTPAFKQTTWFSRNLTQRDGISTVKGVGGLRMLKGISLNSGVNGVLLSDFEKSSHVRNNMAKFAKSPKTRHSRHYDDYAELNTYINQDFNYDPDDEVEV